VSFCTIIIRLCHCTIAIKRVLVRIFVALSCELGGFFISTRVSFDK